MRVSDNVLMRIIESRVFVMVSSIEFLEEEFLSGFPLKR